MLEAIGAGVTPRVGPKDWKDVWLESPECARVKEHIREIKAAALARPEESNKELTRTCVSSVFLHFTYLLLVDAAPFIYQVKEVTVRSLTALWRSPAYVWTRLFIHAFISLFVSLSLLQLGHSSRDLQSRVFGM
jgi:ATP-binding cassette, subfamily G (WHITE), member 2, PDR